MVEVAVRQHQGLDPAEIQVHGPAIAFQGIGIGAGIEEYGAGFGATMRGHRQGQPMMGRTESLARELRHARGHEHAQLRGDVPGTAGQHIGRVIHHDVDRQLVNGLHGCGLLPATRSGISQMTRETYASALPLANLNAHLSSRKRCGQARTTIGKFRGQHTHLSCFFQGIELRDSLGLGERSPQSDAVGMSVIPTPPAPFVANAK